MERITVLAILAVLALLISACGGPGPQVTPSTNLIVPGERIGDLPAVGTAGDAVRAMDFDAEVEFTAGSLYRWLDDANESVWMLYVCTSTDAVTVVYIYDKPGNERFATAEGIGLESSEAEVLAALGDPDNVFEWEDNRQLGYFTTDEVPGLVVAFKTDALDSPFGIWVGTRCN